VKRKQHLLGPIVLTGLLGLYLAVACWFAGPRVPLSLREAFALDALARPQPAGPLGGVLAALAAWALGPWLRWLLPAAPFLWMPLRAARNNRRALAPPARLLLGVVAAVGLLAHPALGRIGAQPSSGGAVGRLTERSVHGVAGALGSFLVLSCVLVWLVLRKVPGAAIRVTFDGEWLRRAGRAARAALALAAQGTLRGAAAAVRWVLARAPQLAAARQAIARPLRALMTRLRARREPAGSPKPQGAAREAGAAQPAAALEERPARQPGLATLPQHWAAMDIAAVPAVPVRAIADGPQLQAPAPSDEPLLHARAAAQGAPAGLAQAELFDASATRDEGLRPTDGGLAGAADAGAADENAGEATSEFRLSRDPAELLRDPSLPQLRRPQRRGKLPLPSLGLLDDVQREERGFTREVLQQNARLLLETLSNYGIEGQINEIRPGPVVTTFEFEPAPGVKVSQITSRQDDLALAMRAVRIRIEAPIPGKAAVGIEIPNPFPQMVTLKQVMAPLLADESRKPLAIALGKDVEGNPFGGDLADMPHLLVAGATGSGKSVCLNALVCNLLLRNGPERVRLLMIDPKMLELSVYNGIPHLLHPVITEAKEALKALRWMVEHMSVRYSSLAKHGVRNIQDYNEKVRAGQVRDAQGVRVEETMPYVVVIVDELADLMMMLGQELETPVARLAQMARAVGIHLVLATQRPSVNVITGVIKANFPSRIAFRVISKIDSRTILDAIGAEQLLGKGDMLFLMAGWAQPVRVHGAYLSLDECERIAAHWRALADTPARLPLDDALAGGVGVELGDDVLLEEARRIVVLSQIGSVSLLQRRLRVGYTRAARLMDMLEEQGVVGPFEGSKAREVLVGRDELEAQS
jgi:DNA segregation ATPase FtsK/SpoIIIE-like protein